MHFSASTPGALKSTCFNAPTGRLATQSTGGFEGTDFL
jgi:hypothetical protein